MDPMSTVCRIIKRITIHCHTQNMEAFGLVVSDEEDYFMFSHCNSMETDDFRGGAI